MQLNDYLQIADYRQQVFDIYARVREPDVAPEKRWLRFRSARDHLFKTHPQTALTPQQVTKFSSLPYFPYDPDYRFILPIEPLKDQAEVRINLQDDGPTLLLPFGQVTFTLSGESDLPDLILDPRLMVEESFYRSKMGPMATKLIQVVATCWTH